MIGSAAWVALIGCVRYPGPIGSLGEPPPFPSATGAPRSEERIPLAPTATPFAAAVVEAATYYFDHAPPLRDDCSGYVLAVFDRAGLALDGNTASLYERFSAAGAVYRRRAPTVGDLAFFDDTYDRNGNGRTDDELSHVGVVVAVESDGTITVAHGGTSGGRTTMVMNLRHPAVRDLGGKRVNDGLRAERKGDPPGTRYLASQLWRAFAAVPVPGARD